MLGELAAYPHVILLKAFTKLYAMAGVRLGYGISSNPAIIEKLERSVQPWNVSSLAQAAGLAALAEDAYVRESLTDAARGAGHIFCKRWRSWAAAPMLRRQTIFFFAERQPSAKNCVRLDFWCGTAAITRVLARAIIVSAVRLHEDNVKLVQALAHILD